MNQIGDLPVGKVTADLRLRTSVDDVEFWSSHPDVMHVFKRPFEGAAPGEVELLIWLSPPPADWRPDWSRRPEPDRPAEIDIWGGGEAHETFFARLGPLIEHMVLIQDYDECEEFDCMGWWAAKIWLKR